MRLNFRNITAAGCIGNFYRYDVKNLLLFISCIFPAYHKMRISLSQHANIDVVCETAYAPAAIMLRNYYT